MTQIQGSSRERDIIAELKVEYEMFTRAINALINQGKRFSPEAARLADERSRVRHALNVHKIYLREELEREAARLKG